MIVKHLIPVDGIPREFTFQYETKEDAKMTPGVDVFAVIDTEEKKDTHFAVTPVTISHIWLGDRLEGHHGKGAVGGGGGGIGSKGFYMLVGKHQTLFPIVTPF